MYNKRGIIFICGMIMTVFSGCSKNQISNEYIELKSYESVRLDSNDENNTVTDGDIELYIKQMQESNTELVEADDKAVENGDIVTIHCSGEMGDVTIEQEHTVIVGEETFLKGLDKSLLGHKKSEIYEFESKFPKDYYDIGFAGKKVTFEIEVKSIVEPRLPKLNDEFIKKISQTSRTVKEYREEVRKLLEERERETGNLENLIWEKLLEKTKVKKYPKDRVEKYILEMTENYKEMATKYNMNYEEFIKNEMCSTPEEFERNIKQDAQLLVKEELLAEAIAKQEEIVMNSEQYEEVCEQLTEENRCEDLNMLKEEVKKEEVQKIILQQEVKKWLGETCKIE